MTTNAFEIKSESGTLRGKLTTSSAVDSRGLLLCLHGSPNGDSNGNFNIFNELAEKAKNIGYSTLQFSLFGSSPSDGSPKQACLRTQVDDYLTVLKYATTNISKDIYVVGESAGATVASMNWQEVRGHVLLWPAFDLRDTDLSPFLSYENFQKVEELGYLETDDFILSRELFIELLTLDFSQSFVLPDHPIFIAHGRSDSEVPFAQSIRAIQNSGDNLTFYASKDADHGFKDAKQRQLLLSELISWLDRL